MICKVQFKSKNDFIEINLKQKVDNINKQSEKEFVYQNQSYETIIRIENNIKEIQRLEVYINNEVISDRFNGLKVTQIDKNDFRIASEYLFSTIFGFANIYIEVIYNDESSEYYYSEYISVAINRDNEEAYKSIQQMIDYIYNKNSTLIYSSNIDRVSNVLSGTEYSKNRGIDTEITLLNQIIAIYNINLKYFMSDLKFKILSNTSVDDFNKVRMINNDTIKFIVANPQELSAVNHKTGINYNGQNLQPVKTLISKNYNSYEIYENKVIIGFLKYLINEITTKVYKINLVLLDNHINLNLKQALEKEYILSSEIVYSYSRITIKKYLQELELIKEALQGLYLKYKHVIRCEEKIVKNIPNPTNIFLSVNHYRNIFTIINKWFKHGNYDMLQNKVILSFLTADEIYEYYCLLNIIQVIKNLDFSEDEINRKKYDYKFNKYNNLYKHSKIDNTFYFSNGSKSLVLYYQPIVYSYENETRNDITLFRTDENNNYYTPDFIIKVDLGDENLKYIILDSKWSTRDTIKKYRYKDAVFKYLFSIKDQRNLNNPNSLWLLQGRDDKNKKNVYNYNNGAISKTLHDTFKKNTGIIRITPNGGSKEFLEIIKGFLE